MSSTGFIPAHKNPFVIERVIALPYLFAEGDWAHHLDRLQQLKFRAAIVGQQGSGKTTLLEQLNQRLPEHFNVTTHYAFLPQEKQPHANMLKEAINESSAGKIVLMDGIERLSFFQRQRLYRTTKKQPGLIINVHQKCRLPTWIHCQPSQTMLAQLLVEVGQGTPEINAAAQNYYKDFGGNIRDVFRALYDDYSAGKFSCDIRQ